MLSCVPLEELTTCPLDGEEMKPTLRLTDFDSADNIGVLYARAILSLSYKTRDCSSIKAKFFPEYF